MINRRPPQPASVSSLFEQFLPLSLHPSCDQDPISLALTRSPTSVINSDCQKSFTGQQTRCMPSLGLYAALRAVSSCNIPSFLYTVSYIRVLDVSAAQSSILWQRALNPVFARHASHQTQGRANGPKGGPGKRLGAKKTGGAHFSRAQTQYIPLLNTQY